MVTCREIISSLSCGALDGELKLLYGGEGLESARARAKSLVETFADAYGSGDREAALFSAPGRTEIGGNHTDHQHGHVLCGSIDLDVLACASPNGTNEIRIRSEGYRDIAVKLDILQPRGEEVSTPAALVRGVAAQLIQRGYPISGFDACMTSNVLSGSGLSSSAAFEVMLGCMMNHFFCSGALTALEISAIGQYAENEFFGKPCGLMDQVASASGGVVSIDFKDIQVPVVRKIHCDLEAYGYVLCIIDTGSCHADLTDDYAGILREMGEVAAYFGKKYLSEVEEGTFRSAVPALREQCGDRAVLRAMHYFGDDARAAAQAKALEEKNFDRFLALVRESGRSSALCLQNTWSPADHRQQAIPLALAVGQELLGDTGAIRVHGGGFAGTVQAFVPVDKADRFKTGIEEIFGFGSCRILHIRPKGGCVLIG